ncbi:hypothetical protein C5E06_13355 [Pseudoclavibacter sp. RFBI5]|nr:hypothetical protein C5E06_13355 [Pseudoclavibacter sp. RFBI5]
MLRLLRMEGAQHLNNWMKLVSIWWQGLRALQIRLSMVCEPLAVMSQETWPPLSRLRPMILRSGINLLYF